MAKIALIIEPNCSHVNVKETLMKSYLTSKWINGQ